MTLTLDEVLRNIKDPRNWADFDAILAVLEQVPSVRGMVYGNLAEVEFAKWLVENGIPSEHQTRDDDHKKTKSDRTIRHNGRSYTIQLKSMQTNSIKEPMGSFTAKIQCDASDRRTVKLPSGDLETTCYLVGEFDVLGVPLHPFLGEWGYTFKLNSDLPRSTYRNYTEAQREYLLASFGPITWPLTDDWTTDLLGLLASSRDLGTVLEEDDTHKVVIPEPWRAGDPDRGDLAQASSPSMEWRTPPTGDRQSHNGGWIARAGRRRRPPTRGGHDARQVHRQADPPRDRPEGPQVVPALRRGEDARRVREEPRKQGRALLASARPARPLTASASPTPRRPRPQGCQAQAGPVGPMTLLLVLIVGGAIWAVLDWIAHVGWPRD